MTETLSPALPDAIERKAADLLETACARDLSFVTAESCTGGMLAALLTDVEGASHAFDRGFVVYSEGAKCELLGVERDMLDDCGAVSRNVAVAMARGALRGSDADIALSVTGFAGPGAPGDEPGLVHFACAIRNGAETTRECHFGDIGRGAVRVAALEEALSMLVAAVDQASSHAAPSAA
ncbi:CinA family protein [Sphingomonas sp. VNH70]|uniref:CinA family protein n=1 Tax=Sphingomonas silueang TaxID=3156617 RepID=UPI0032B37149